MTKSDKTCSRVYISAIIHQDIRGSQVRHDRIEREENRHMRLGFFHYGLGEARIIAYHRELLDIEASIEGIDQSVPFQAYAPIFHVSPPVGMKNVTLTASKNGEILGTCICQFNKGMHVSEPTGTFDGIPA